jgi:hypothetical protein
VEAVPVLTRHPQKIYEEGNLQLNASTHSELQYEMESRGQLHDLATDFYARSDLKDGRGVMMEGNILAFLQVVHHFKDRDFPTH